MRKPRFILVCLVLLGGLGCQPQPRMEEPPPAQQQVVMVPSWKEGVPQTAPKDAAATAKAPALAPGSTPDGPQPGDLDYKGSQ